jgi:glycosyltransferase involved in cell wall biosynthesis
MWPLRRAPSALDKPALSVIVPVYNVERYIRGSLDSMLRQPFDDIEIIVIDDESPDDSAQIARSYARKDGRVRVVEHANAGPGGARNFGIPFARGEFLTFVDPDDELPKDAWSRMVGRLRDSGSDFIVGGTEMVVDGRFSRTPRMRANYAQSRVRATIHDRPELLADVFLWNKVFRQDFWQRCAFQFPERVPYSDQPVITEAFLRASSFDVLPETVYHWRIRGDGTSITQRRHRIEDLEGRLLTKRLARDHVLAFGDAEVTRVFFADVLPADMFQYFRKSVGAPDDYWALLRGLMDEFWNPGTVEFVQAVVPVQQRLMGYFVQQDRRDDLARLIAFIDDNGGPILGDGEFQHPWRDEPGLPVETVRLAEHEL